MYNFSNNRYSRFNKYLNGDVDFFFIKLIDECQLKKDHYIKMEQIEIANFDRNMELFYAIRFAREGFFSKEITLPDYMFTAIMYGYNTEWDRTHSILDFLETKDFLLRLKNELYKTPSIFLTKEPGDSTEGDDTSNNKTSETK